MLRTWLWMTVRCFVCMTRPHIQNLDWSESRPDSVFRCETLLHAWTMLQSVNVSFSLAGNTDAVTVGKNRMFLGYPYCRKSLGLDVGKTYLLMGTSRDIRREIENNVVTWVCPLVVFGSSKCFCNQTRGKFQKTGPGLTVTSELTHSGKLWAQGSRTDDMS